MSTLADFRTKMNVTVKDTAAKFTQGEKDNFIQEANRQYSRDRRRIVVALLTGDGSNQVFTTPTGWTDRLSLIQVFEFPIDNVPRTTLDVQDHISVEVQTDDTERIITKLITLGASEQARIFFDAQHSIPAAGNTTIPENDFDAVANLAASKFARALAAFYAESTEASLDADVVNHAAKSTLFTELADKLLGMYKEHIESGDVVPGELRHFDIDINLFRGHDFFFHQRQFR